ncbi:hypothetical protein D3C84_994040 [compost metagenome]
MALISAMEAGVESPVRNSRAFCMTLPWSTLSHLSAALRLRLIIVITPLSVPHIAAIDGAVTDKSGQ